MPICPSVSILMPVLNEEAYVRQAIASLVPKGELDYELLVLDGGSTDQTRQIVQEMSVSNPRIRLIDNDARIQSAGVNKGAALAMDGSAILVRADCHATYPPQFIPKLMAEMAARKVASVVVPMHTIGTSFLQRAIAAAQNSRLGNGGAAHRSALESRFVEHGHHAAFDRAVFVAVGGYDETFSHNEDAELDLRLTKSGHKIWLCSDLAIAYFPRKFFSSLARQYFNYGSGRARTVFKHHCVPGMRQMLPIAVLAGNFASLGLGLIAHWLFFLPAAGYLAACTLWSAALATRQRDIACLLSSFAAAVMHHSWAAGFIYRSFGLLMRRSDRNGAVGQRLSASISASKSEETCTSRYMTCH
jgi:succinoglycan biosynthesis protein ExoA